jgi:hypothetical protein
MLEEFQRYLRKTLFLKIVGSKNPNASHPKDLSARHRPALGLDFPLVMLHTHSQSTP